MEPNDSTLASSLVQSGELTPEQLAALCAEQRSRPGSSLAAILVEKGILKPGDVARTSSAGLPPEVTAALADPRRRVGRYVLLSELGRGGMGVVYRAYDVTLRRPAAIKMILDPAHADAEQLKRFTAEAHATAKLAHPGIVSIYEIAEHGGRPFIAMELIEGESLEKRLAREPVTPRRAAELVRDIALALEHAHQHGIVHRDVKPENVIVDRQGKTHLMDFGLAHDASRGERLTVSGAALGTPAYMAPEQAGEKALQGPRSDVYALGALFYRALVGKPPFDGGTFAEIITRVLLHPPLPPRELDPKIPAPLEAVVLRCLQKKPDDRYPSAAALAKDLERFLATGRVAATRSPAKGATRGPSKTVAIAAGAGALALLLGIGLLARSPAPAPRETPSIELDGPKASPDHPLLLGEPVLAVSGRISDPTAGPVRIVEPGKQPLEVPVNAEGGFSTRLALDPRATSVEVHAGAEPHEASVSIAVEIDPEPPRLEIEAPESWRAGPLEVAAVVHARHPGVFRFSLGGSPASEEARPDAAGRARASLEVPADAQQLEVTVEVDDALGRKDRQVRTVRIEAPPKPTAEPPAPPPSPPPPAPARTDVKLALDKLPARTNAAKLTLRGRVDPEVEGTASVSLLVPGREAAPSTFDVHGSNLEAELPLPDTDGTYLVLVQVHARDGGEASASLSIVVDRALPAITIQPPQPAPGARTISLVIATTKPLASLLANGAELVKSAPEAGPFAFELPVPAAGEPRLELVARDETGNEARPKPFVYPRPSAAHAEAKGPRPSDTLKRGKESGVYVFTPARNKKLEIEMVYVPPGTFTMGDGDSAHAHATGGYLIGRTQVTWKQYRAYCKSANATLPEPPTNHEGKGSYEPTDERPVTMVSWDDARAFCEWAGLRLPTEAEWERAARGDADRRRNPWGDDAPDTDRCWCLESCADAPAPPVVGSKKRLAGASPFGALDMVGSIWEWCVDTMKDDAYERYKAGKLDPPTGEGSKVMRGTPFTFNLKDAGCAGRWCWGEGGRDWRIGFRVALDGPKSGKPGR